MPESIEQFHARVAAAQAAAGGHLPLPEGGYTEWPSFPFEGDLRVRPVLELTDERPREGEVAAECWCHDGRLTSHEWPVVWRDQHWHIKAAPPSGVPCILILEPNDHVDLPDLTEVQSARFGVLSVALTRHLEALPSVGRCHIGRWGDGGAHAHVWFLARPARMPQLRGTFNALWDDLLPPIPVAVRDENVAFVVDRLVASHGGEALHA